MQEKESQKVFLSYSRCDSGRALRLYKQLTKRGISVWFDQAELRPGVRWKSVIAEAVRNSQFILALLSDAALRKRGYFQSELRMALEVLDEFPDDQPFLIPVRLEPLRLPADLGDLHCVDLFPTSTKGLNEILRLFGVPASIRRAGKEQPTKPKRPRTDGIYCHDALEAEGAIYYLRFLPTGEVFSQSSDWASTPTDAIPYLHADYPILSKGRYTVQGDRLDFFTVSKDGMIRYSGLLRSSRLTLIKESLITGKKGILEYSFHRLSQEKRKP